MRLPFPRMYFVQPQQTLPIIAKAALLVVDMQNDFVRAGAPFEVPAALDTIPPQQKLLHTFRKHNLPVVFLKWIGVADDPYLNMQYKFSWARALSEDVKGCRIGHPRHYSDIDGVRDCSAVIDELMPIHDEIQLTKRGYGGFFGTPLDAILREREVDGVVITGVMAECCVEDTARQAYQLHYPAVVVTDGVATYDPHATKTMLDVVDKNFGWVADSNTIARWIASTRRSDD